MILFMSYFIAVLRYFIEMSLATSLRDFGYFPIQLDRSCTCMTENSFPRVRSKEDRRVMNGWMPDTYCKAHKKGNSSIILKSSVVLLSLTVHLETKLSWCQTTSWKKKVIIFTTVTMRLTKRWVSKSLSSWQRPGISNRASGELQSYKLQF